jgi:phenylalanyl-tRNA synthetase alpha subunit
MSDELETLKSEFLGAVAAATSLAALDEVRVRALGKKGAVTQRMKNLGGLDPEERKQAGQALNRLKDEIAAAIEARKEALGEEELEARLAEEGVDVSLPARPAEIGRIHPISQTVDEMVAIFGEMGFSVAVGPHIEDDFHNFTALNIPPEHPARQEHDTFYTTPSTCPRARTASARCCALTPRRCRSAPCRRAPRRSASSCPGAPSAPTTTPPIRPCSISSRAWWSTRPPTWAT